MKLWRSCRDSGGRTVSISDFGRKIRLNFGEELFFLRSSVVGRKNRFNFRFPPKNPSQFWINRLNLIRKQWKFGSRSFTVVSLFQTSPPPPFSKSWLSAWPQNCSIYVLGFHKLSVTWRRLFSKLHNRCRIQKKLRMEIVTKLSKSEQNQILKSILKVCLTHWIFNHVGLNYVTPFDWSIFILHSRGSGGGAFILNESSTA